METIRNRARDLLPNILLTLLSMIQALALEIFWSRFQQSEFLWEGGWPMLLGWLQVLAILLGISQVWLFYVSLILRFSWVPGLRDMLLPFVIGLLEFTLVDLQGVDRIGSWLLCLAAIFAVATTESHLIFRAARRDPTNRSFFEGLAPAAFSDYVPTIVVVLLLASLGVAVRASGSQGLFAFVALVFAVAALLYQVYVTAFYWYRTITLSDEAND